VTGIDIVSYDERDHLAGACRTYADAFHASYWPMIDETDPELVRDVVTGMTAFSNDTVVALDGGEVVGILIGYTGFAARRVAAAGTVLLSRVVPGLLLGRYHASPRALRFLLDVTRDLTVFELFGRPRVDPCCEILLFAVRGAAQGKGLGRRMMDEFVRRARGAGAKLALVTTDTTLAWHFYPAYGFERIRSAPFDRCYRESQPGVEVRAFRYALDLTREVDG
jgi:ribosomal protein S18 acetylase RimI-like enzyme